jgi:hypothetical protein
MLRLVDEANARQLPALVAEWANGPNRWIARALRIDLALLTERPELAVPCVYRRCAFVGNERGFYERTDPSFDRLRDMMADWAARTRSPWLRSLRVPIIPIDGAVIEEYRTGITGALWVSDDGERIGIAGETAHIAWERATGRRLDGARARPTASPRPTPWREGTGSTWGALVLERGDDRVQLAMPDDQNVSDVYTCSDHEVLVTGYDIEYDHFYALVDTQRAEFRWRDRGRIPSATALDAEHVIIAREGAVDIVRLATGERVASWRCPSFEQALALPDGNVAMRSGHVIRVWNVAEARERAQLVYPAQNSFISAAFSPDGRRLVTGNSLCERETGRFIANLGCTGPHGWLEGGPPPDCQRLCNGVFAEVTPFGLSIWDSHDGRALVQHDGERRGRPSDLVAFDPMGKYHAIWSERGSLRVFHLAKGGMLRELQQPMPKDSRRLGFSADGSLLAWVNAHGECWAIRVADPNELYPIAPDEHPWEPPMTTVDIADGLLVTDGAAIPFDDQTATVHDKDFAGSRSHVRLA